MRILVRRPRASAWPPLRPFCLGLTGCKDKQSQAAVPPPKPSVDAVTLCAQPVKLITELPGRTSPYRTAEVRPQVNGIILKRLFTEGDTVQAGQQLYQIDPAPMRPVWPVRRQHCCTLRRRWRPRNPSSVTLPPAGRRVRGTAGRTWTTRSACWSRTRRTSRQRGPRSKPPKSTWCTPRGSVAISRSGRTEPCGRPLLKRPGIELLRCGHDWPFGAGQLPFRIMCIVSMPANRIARSAWT